jgi:uncharacterized protein YdeI (YjbR/CyaY-like superfamily)
MPSTDTRIDSYIEKSDSFAKPILKHLRQLVHKGCPEVEETIKWGFPHFEYKGILCSMASFKQHCSFGFWKASVMKDEKKLLNPVGKTAMGHFGRITSLKDLPADKVIIEYIKEAVRLNENEIKLPTRIKAGTTKKELKIPDDLLAALKKNKAAMKTYENFSPSNKKEYVEWITGAKTEDTRKTRLQTAIEWMSDGKIRNWKYVR